MFTVLLVVHILVTVALIGIILIQRNDSDGAILGGGGNSFMTGRGAATLITRATAVLATAFILTSIALTKVNSHTSGSLLDQIGETAPLSTPTPPIPADNTAPTTAPAAPAEPAAPSVPKPQ